MTDSILQNTKKLLGLDSEYTEFDEEIKIHINSAFSALSQLGAAPPEGFMLITGEETWDSLLEDRTQIEMVKTWLYLKVRLVFDPPTTSFAITAIENQISELNFRLNVLELLYNPRAYDVVVENTEIEL